MEVQRVPVASLKFDPQNVRIHPTKNLEAIRESLRRFGQQKPIVVDRDQVVRAGNGTLQAAKDLGWTEVDIVVSDLSPEDLSAFAVTDNRTGELSEWDVAQLRDVLDELRAVGVSVEGLGWDTGELVALSKSAWKPAVVGALPGVHAPPGAEATIEVVLDQRIEGVVGEVVARIREEAGSLEMSEGEALVRACERGAGIGGVA